MINRKYIYLILCSLIFMFLCFFINVKTGKAVIDDPCSKCHTMHNSQNGTAVVGTITYPNGTTTQGPFRALTIGDCIICHSDLPSVDTGAPKVYTSSEPTYVFGAASASGSSNVTAGGNFWWVADTGGGNSTTGHNVVGIARPDTDITQPNQYTPPGWDPNYATSPNGTTRTTDAQWNQQLTCAGNWGCHGKFNINNSTLNDPFAAISGAHHKNKDLANGTTTFTDVYDSYRFLWGIVGAEDTDWELTVGINDHNGYYAVDSPSNSTTPADKKSINYLCGECHGKFHYGSYSGSYQSPWLRHPTDYDMNNVSDKEYGAYPNVGLFNIKGASANGTYFPEVPVGNAQGAVLDTVIPGTDTAIVLCISCHKAHASKYADILRWNYEGACNATGGDTTKQNSQCGCFACHTSK